MPIYLEDIVAYKREEVAAAKAASPRSQVERMAEAADPPRGFRAALESARAQQGYGLIAEIKKASPSKGLIRKDFDPPRLAQAYARGGAACLSVLTDGPSFMGDPSYLAAARAAAALPVLRKDFMVDSYQIAESRALGADCILLILACLSDAEAGELMNASREFGMDVLVEVHTGEELARASDLDSDLIGINNRNLKTFDTNIQTSIELSAAALSDALLVSESGIGAPSDVARLKAAGVDCFLVGESLMRKEDVETAARELFETS
ncbi:MAG: indole-3-glycerol phosphate synthase TrpC [Pseudomonadota bacterium]